VASKIGFDQKLDAQVPLDIPLKDEAGKPVRLGDFFGERPVILTLVYHECPMLCNEVLNALTRGLKGMTFDVGDQFEVVTVSINPAETPELAAAKKAGYLRRYGRPGGREWLALPDGRRGLDPQARAVGRVPLRLHARVEAVRPRGGARPADARGRVARYFFGISYAPRDLRLGLTEASAGRSARRRPDAPLLLPVRPVDRQVHVCDHERPALLATATALVLGAYVSTMLWRERGGRRAGSDSAGGDGGPRADGAQFLPTTP
jgi:protein SCO1/2